MFVGQFRVRVCFWRGRCAKLTIVEVEVAVARGVEAHLDKGVRSSPVWVGFVRRLGLGVIWCVFVGSG